MLDSYPPHLIARRVTKKGGNDDGSGDGGVVSSPIVLDGRLDDAAWSKAEWTTPMVDITRHTDTLLNTVPPEVQTRVKVLWDDDYFYVGAELAEPYVTGALYGHNNIAPYHDNDFEVFIDVSGTTQYYVEYEMNLLNSTYDIKWGKPDQTSLRCGVSPLAEETWPALPTCVNSSVKYYNGTWTMASQRIPGPYSGINATHAVPATTGTTAAGSAHAGDTGLLSATAWDVSAFDTYTYPNSMWSLEIRFPIRQTPNYSTQPLSQLGSGAHGGLLDADPKRQHEWNAYDPALGDAGLGRPRYWWVNFARAEHPRNYTLRDGTSTVCPFNCTASLEHAINSTLATMAESKRTWPTVLWGGYWEWVWGPVGDANPGIGYMHRPSAFPMVQFAQSDKPDDVKVCRNIEHPGRHVAKSLHLAQAAYAAAHGGAFSDSVAPLINNATYCQLAPSKSDTCDLDALRLAAQLPNVFELRIANLTQNATVLTRECPTRPCYTATVRVTVPGSDGYIYVTSVNSNRDIRVQHLGRHHQSNVHVTKVEEIKAPCL